jgi:branched-chain amino acid transport system permease protein
MELLFGQIINAILLGCTYTLVAIGFSLFFGVMDVVVFCAGDIAIFGAFPLWELTRSWLVQVFSVCCLLL